MDLTPNLNLEKPVGNENFRRQIFNSNMDKIDVAVASKETPAGAQAKANAAETNAKTYIDTKLASLIAAAPAALDTLKELADALGDDPNFATTIANLIGTKASLTDLTNLSTIVNTHTGEDVSDLEVHGLRVYQDALQVQIGGEWQNVGSYQTPFNMDMTGEPARVRVKSWTTGLPGKPTSIGLWDYTSFKINDEIYVVGGNKTVGGAVSDVNDVFNTVTKTWTTKANMPTALRLQASVSYGGKGYVFGGGTYSGNYNFPVANTYEYNPTTNQWTAKQAMPTARQLAEAVEIDGIAYVAGGIISGSEPLVTEAYNIATNTWTSKANLPSVRTGRPCFVHNGLFFIVQGTSLICYSPTLNQWIDQNPLPSSISGQGKLELVNGLIYIPSGSTHLVFNPATGTWDNARTPCPGNLTTEGVYNVNGKAFSLYNNYVYIYDPSADTHPYYRLFKVKAGQKVYSSADLYDGAGTPFVPPTKLVLADTETTIDHDCTLYYNGTVNTGIIRGYIIN